MKDNSIKKQLLLTIVLTLVTSGCGQGFQSKTSCLDATQCENASNGPGTGSPSKPNQEWDNLQLDGAISGGRFAQTPVVSIDKEKKLLKVRLPMINPLLLIGILPGPMQIPELSGGTLSWESMSDGTPVMVVNIPLERFLKGLEVARKDRLPNGEPLPGVADGELPSIGINLLSGRNTRATIYLGPSVMAVFVNTPFDPVIRTPLIPIRDQGTARTMGYFAVIPAVGGFEGGFYLSFALPAEIARIIDDYL